MRSRIVGTLSVEEGEKVTDARVAVASWGFDGADPRGPWSASAVPKTDGSFEFTVPSGSYSLLARHSRGAVELEDIPVDGETNLGRLEIRPISDVRIPVTSRADGAVVSGASVGWSKRRHEPGGRGRDALEQDLFSRSRIQIPVVDGVIHRRDLPQGDFQVQVDAGGFLREVVEVHVDGPDAQTVQCRLRPALVTEVVFNSGLPDDPDESYTLHLLGEGGQPVYGEGGLQRDRLKSGDRVELLPGSYRVDVSRRGDHDSREIDVARIQIEAGQQEIVVAVSRADLRVEVIGPSGPVPHADVRVVAQSGERRTARRLERTDAWGMTTTRIRPGSLEVRVRAESAVPHSETVSIPSGKSTIQIEVPGGSISGRLIMDDGAPVSGGEVLLVEDFVDARGVRHRGPFVGNTARNEARAGGGPYPCDATGRFLVSHVPAGTYWMIGTAEDCGHAYASGGPVTVGDTAVENLTVPLAPSRRVVLRCDEDWVRVMNAEGWEMAAFLQIDELRTESGRRRAMHVPVYTWEKLAPGSYTLILKSYGPRARDGSRPSDDLGTWQLTFGAGQRELIVDWPALKEATNQD